MQFITELRIKYLKRRLNYFLLKAPLHKINLTKVRRISKKLKDLGYVPGEGYTLDQIKRYDELGIFKIKKSTKEHKTLFVKPKIYK